ncbi:VIN3-like protein 2 isoform X2 [Rhododendron vialii]|uniref:VIN3-like protein 2 isoform X2 n=1 Tax=Rhododendron vialii TaxID=182163 RepID=UPI00265F2555|nr:VIN3-like protein 2 isoform X2 [Rhododendron vialii]XP_058211191.1 VIN3-like protein 2 isoform X2 [Rhododendron vialii]XP_058211196.1 VIN3-like protein 2 isoform X2 [Rhododendron vialii]
MDSPPFEGVVLDPSKCSMLSMEEKRELVYEPSKWSHGAPEMLQSWSRQEILQILCAEMGKERKYTGLTKLKIIEHLLRVIAEKKSQGNDTAENPDPQCSPSVEQRASKRQRKTDQPSRLAVAVNSIVVDSSESDMINTIYCKNSACKAKLSQKDVFCKRCSCCICSLYDDNKDPSLWLTCSSEPPYPGDACGMSCHLECALRHNKSGIAKDGMDGSFSCVACGKLNDLLGCWRKQLITAKETRRVDILCYRVSLSQKLLVGTKYYQNLYELVDGAVKKLEEDVGPLTGLPVKNARGIVNRLSSGPDVQRLCALAVESLDSMLSKALRYVSSNYQNQESTLIASNIIQFGEVCTSSVTLILGSKAPALGNVGGYTLWHRKVEDGDYLEEPTCTLFTPNMRFLLSGLSPATEYVVKVVCFNSTKELGKCEVPFRTGTEDDVATPNNIEVVGSESPATNCSSLSNPSSVEDENTTVVLCSNETQKREDTSFTYCKDKNTEKTASANLSNDINLGDPASSLDEEGAKGRINSVPSSIELNLENKGSQEEQGTSADSGSHTHIQTGMECVVPLVGSSEADLPITPCKLENNKDVARNGRLKPSNKVSDNVSGREEEHSGNSNRDFEYYVKVIRWLECEGHIETAFRQKFLTWYSLRATPQEMRVVKVFVDTLIDDPVSLAGQLVDSFSETISSKRSSDVPSGFCPKLWH